MNARTGKCADRVRRPLSTCDDPDAEGAEPCATRDQVGPAAKGRRFHDRRVCAVDLPIGAHWNGDLPAEKMRITESGTYQKRGRRQSEEPGCDQHVAASEITLGE